MKESVKARRFAASGSCMVVAALCAAIVAPARGQMNDKLQSVGSMRGRVIDGATKVPLAGSTVTLERLGANTPMDSTLTDGDGEYFFDGVSPGDYRISATRIGYRSYSVEIVLREESAARVSLALMVEPITLEPLTVTQRRHHGMDLSDTDSDSLAMADAPFRAGVFLPGDSHRTQATHHSIQVAAMEPDLFRGLSRLAGIDLRDDYNTRLHVRGAPWSDTRVSFDGLPVLDPIHGGGLFAGLAPLGVGAVWLHPGAQPPDGSSGAAGSLRIESRSASRTGVDVGASLAAAHTRVDAIRGAWKTSLSIRGASLGLLSRLAGWSDEEERRDGLPFAFWDAVGRTDVALGATGHMSVSFLRSRDAIPNEERSGLSGNHASWGSDATGITGEHRVQRVAFQWRAGHFDHNSTVAYTTAIPDTTNPDHVPPSVPAMESRVNGWRGSLEIAPYANRTWAIGLSWTQTAMAYHGAVPVPLAGAPLRGEFERSSRRTELAAWAERSFQLSPHWRAWGALRGEALRNTGVYLAPRVAIRLTPSRVIQMELAAGRHIQHEQSLAGAGFETGPALTPGLAWIQTDDLTPAIRADIITADLRLRTSDSSRLAGTLFARRSSGHLVLDPGEGQVVASPPLEAADTATAWAIAQRRAAGVELTGSWSRGRWSSELSYTAIWSVIDASATRAAAPEARRHAVDAGVSFRLSSGATLGLTVDAGSGLPYRRFRPNSCDPQCLYGPASTLGIAEQAGAERSPGHVRVDFSTSWHARLWGDAAALQVGVQVVNLLGFRNPGTYLGSERVPCGSSARDCDLVSWVDRFVPGLPRLPMLAIRARF